MVTFKEARAFLLQHRTDYDAAVKGFRWPDPVPFNWALDWFDAELARSPDSRDRAALWIVDAGSGHETKLSFAELSRRSNQLANFLRAQGLKRGDHLLLLLGNVVPLWETMLAAMKLGVVVIPATTLLTPDELQDRLDRGRARVVVATQDQVAKFAKLRADKLVRIVVGASSKVDGWLPFEQSADAAETFASDGPTAADEPIILLQKVTHESRVHLDIETDDIEAEASRLEKLGAKRINLVRDRWWVMEAPSGHRFCVVRQQREPFGPHLNAWDGTDGN